MELGHKFWKVVSPGHKTSTDAKIFFQLRSYSGSVTLFMSSIENFGKLRLNALKSCRVTIENFGFKQLILVGLTFLILKTI